MIVVELHGQSENMLTQSESRRTKELFCHFLLQCTDQLQLISFSNAILRTP